MFAGGVYQPDQALLSVADFPEHDLTDAVNIGLVSEHLEMLDDLDG